MSRVTKKPKPARIIVEIRNDLGHVFDHIEYDVARIESRLKASAKKNGGKVHVLTLRDLATIGDEARDAVHDAVMHTLRERAES